MTIVFSNQCSNSSSGGGGSVSAIPPLMVSGDTVSFIPIAGSTVLGNPTGSAAQPQAVGLASNLRINGGNLDTAASPTFAGLILTGFSGVVKAVAGVLTAALILTADISNAQVTYPKMQDVSANRILGNPTGSSASPSEIPFTSNFRINAGSLDLGLFPSATTYAAFTSSSVTTPLTTSNIGYYIRNSSGTNNSWMSYAFLSAAGNVCGLIGAQTTDQANTVVDIVLFGASSGSGATEGFRLVGATNTVNLAHALPIGSGGTGVTSTPTNGQILIGNGSGYTIATLTQGTGVTITNGSGSCSIAIGQSVATSANPVFAGMTLTAFSGVLKAAAGVLSAATIVNADVSSTAAIAFTKMQALTANAVPFIGSSTFLTQDASFFVYDPGSHRLSIGTNTFLSAIPLYIKGITSVINATMVLDAPTGTAKASIEFMNNSVLKWEIGKSVNGFTDDFSITDAAGAGISFLITTGGNITIGNNSSSQLSLNTLSSTSASTNTGGSALPVLVKFINVNINGVAGKMPWCLP